MLVGSLVFAGLVGLAVLAAAWMVWRAGRRRLRALRRHSAVRSAAALWALARPAPASGPPLAARVVDGLSTARSRYELWRGVGAAERAVRQATTSGAALGDLPSLSRRLHEVAVDVDRLLAIGDGLSPAVPEVGGARQQAVEVLRASDCLRRAALAAAGDATGTRVSALADDADREVRSLAAGLARARSTLTPGA